MKGFIVALIMIALILATVTFFTCYSEVRLRELYDSAEAAVTAEDFGRVREEYDKSYALLSLCAPDEMLYDVERALSDCERVEVAEADRKSRLLLAIEELRRQAGFSPVTVI